MAWADLKSRDSFRMDGNLFHNPLVAKAKLLLRDLACSFLFASQIYRAVRFVRDILGHPRTLTIFAYHKINNDRITGNYIRPHVRGFPVGTFAKEMAYLRKRHAVICLDDAVKAIENRKRLPRNAVCITFDDGYRDNYTNAYRILRSLRLPATFFLTTAFIGCRRPAWQVALSAYLRLSPLDVLVMESFDESLERLSEAGRKALRCRACALAEGSALLILRRMLKHLGPDDIEEIVDRFMPEPARPDIRLPLSGPKDRAKARRCLTEHLRNRPVYERELLLEIMRVRLGLKQAIYVPCGEMMTWKMVRDMAQSGMSFGAHTCAHPILTRVPRRFVEGEIVRSKRRLETALGKRVMLFCYPNGREADFDDEIVATLREAGFEAACSMLPGANTQGSGLFALKRIGPERNISVFAMKASGFLS